MRILCPTSGNTATSRDELCIRVSNVNPSVGLFGPTRRDSRGRPKMHRGLDLLTTHGQYIHAAHDGTVTRAGWENPADPRQGFGRRV